MDETYNTYEYYIERAKISFQNTCNNFYNPSFNVQKILVRDLNIQAECIIGLNFIFQDLSSCLITRDGVVFFKQTTYTQFKQQNF